MVATTSLGATGFFGVVFAVVVFFLAVFFAVRTLRVAIAHLLVGSYRDERMLPQNSRLIYKVCTAAERDDAVAAGAYRGSVVDVRDGFIHFSTAAQLPETLRRHFPGRRDLVLVAVDPDDLGARLRWEPSRGGDLFPHLYGELPVTLVRQVCPLEIDGEGHP
jgi:uncharacterized protein (DUF952 family)